MTRLRTPQEYAALWDDPRWQRVRLAILSRDEWRCRLCGTDSGKLSVHHIKYTTELPWDESHANLIGICERCHERVRHCRTTEEEVAFRKLIRPTKENVSFGQLISLSDALRLVPRPTENAY